MLTFEDRSVYNGDPVAAFMVAIKHTQGTGYRDPSYPQKVAVARQKHDRVTHYLFGEHSVSAVEEVAFFKSQLLLQPGDVLAFDWESYNKQYPTQAERDQVRDELRRQLPSHRIVLYCNTNFYRNIDTNHAAGWDGLWIADPNNPAGKPGISDPWWAQQWGIINNVDQNVLNPKLFPNASAYDEWAHFGHHYVNGVFTWGPGPSTPAKPTPTPVPVKPVKHAWTDRTTLNGKTVNYGTLQAFQLLLHYVGWGWLTGRVIQGSYNTSVGASAGTHSGGGALDIDVRGWTPDQIAVLLTWARWVGFAAWHRLPSQGPWIEHVHMILIGDPDLAQQAAAQVLAYRDHKNGLANNGPDDFPFQPFHVFKYAA